MPAVCSAWNVRRKCNGWNLVLSIRNLKGSLLHDKAGYDKLFIKDDGQGGAFMAEKNFIFSMKPYDVDALTDQAAWMLQKRVEHASRKRLSGLWKIIDKLNMVPRAPEAEQKRRRACNRRWSGLFLVMGIFLFVPGVMKPQELPGPFVAGFLAIVMGLFYLRREGKKKNKFEKQARQLLANMNSSMEGQKLRIIFYDTGLAVSGIGEDKKISYAAMECALETADMFALIYDNRIILLQKQELLLGTAEEFGKRLEENVNYACLDRQ